MGEKIFGSENESEDTDEPVVVESEIQDANTSENSSADNANNSIVRPVDNVDEVVEVYNQFEDIKADLLDTNKDLTEIGDGVHVNKSGWRKIATAFNLSVEMVSMQSEVEDDIIKYTAIARATAPNDKTITSTGMCASNESNFMQRLDDGDDWHKDDDDVYMVDGSYRRIKPPNAVKEHNVMTIAETRAKNRAISDLVGGGEVSAEEMAARKKEEILE